MQPLLLMRRQPSLSAWGYLYQLPHLHPLQYAMPSRSPQLIGPAGWRVCLGQPSRRQLLRQLPTGRISVWTSNAVKQAQRFTGRQQRQRPAQTGCKR